MRSQATEADRSEEMWITAPASMLAGRGFEAGPPRIRKGSGEPPRSLERGSVRRSRR
jgi:hypothetical protein